MVHQVSAKPCYLISVRLLLKVSYFTSPYGVPFEVNIPNPIKYTRTFTLEDGQQEKVEILYTSFGPCNMDIRDFTLSAFGIPEPDFGEHQTSPVRYLLATIAVLMIIVALWRMYLKRGE